MQIRKYRHHRFYMRYGQLFTSKIRRGCTGQKLNTYLLSIIIFTSILLFAFPQNACASAQDSLQQQLSLALKYKHATYTDSMAIILESLLEELKKQDELASPLALEARLHLVERKLDTSDDFDDIPSELHQILNAASQQEEWEILANSNIILSYLYELTRKKKTCLEYLAQALDLIKSIN